MSKKYVAYSVRAEQWQCFQQGSDLLYDFQPFTFSLIDFMIKVSKSKSLSGEVIIGVDCR